MTVDAVCAPPDAWTGFVPGRWSTGVDVADFVRHNRRRWTGMPPTPDRSPRTDDLVRRAADGVGTWVTRLVVGLPAGAWPGPADTPTVTFDGLVPQQVRAAFGAGLLTGQPLGEGRVLGDYRRVALYGTDHLVEHRRRERDRLDDEPSTEPVVQRRWHLTQQLRALQHLAETGRAVGADLTRPARTAREAVQWVMLAYLTTLRDGTTQPAWSRITPFWDTYLARDLALGTLTESDAQEVMDDVVLVLGLVQRLRPRSLVTVTLGGLDDNGEPSVTETCVRFFRALRRVTGRPPAELAVLWSTSLPKAFRKLVAQADLAGEHVTYVSDTLVRTSWGADAALVGESAAAVPLGRRAVLGGVRVNLAKALLYAINGGRDELTGRQVGPVSTPVAAGLLDFDDVVARFVRTLDWVARAAVDALTVAHTVQDQHADEPLADALADITLVRTLACESIGLPVAADALAAIRYADVHAVPSTDGLVDAFVVDGPVPRFGSGDRRADAQAVWVLRRFMSSLRVQHTYRGAVHAQGVVRTVAADGETTGATPDGRAAHAPLVPVPASPDRWVESAAAMPYRDAVNGLVCPYPVGRATLGASPSAQVAALVALVDHAVGRGAYGVRTVLVD